MEIDLTSLNLESVLDIDGKVIIPKEYLSNSTILELKDVVFKGTIKYFEDEITLKGTISGIMVVEDLISLDAINYEFNTEIEEEIEENSQKSQNILDITDILWQNIILEVPLKFTNVSNFDEYHGDGWKLISEDSKEFTNNPFNELEDMLREE